MPGESLRHIRGTALPLRGDNIDTDRIIPARFLRAVSFEGLEEHLFTDDRAQAEAHGRGFHPFSDPRYAAASILLVNENFGCGSSREHAPQAIRRRGIRAVVGQSFSEIFFGNALALGMPCVSAAGATVSTLMDKVERDSDLLMDVDLDRMTLTAADSAFEIGLPAPAREALLDGSWDATGLLLDRSEEVEAVAARLPYVRW